MYTDEQRKRFLSRLEKNHGNVAKTCREMGIRGAHATVKLWKDKYPWFGEAMEETVHREFDQIEANVFEAAVNGPPLNATAMSARRFLLCYHPEGRRRGYGRKEEVEGTVQIRSFVDLIHAVEGED